ncbi:MAG: SCO family protein [Bacteroidetes bacterium]|nr:SCO family protein [Bacteroidota bacterium]
MKKKKVFQYIIFFGAIVILFFIATFAGTDNLKTKSPVLSYVRPFTFTTQDGKPFTQKDMLGKVCVVNFFFTTCKGICPRMNGNIKTIYDQFKDQPDFLIVSHTCDPETDSASVLKKYADKMQVDTHKWVFLTGRKDSLYLQARNSYLLDDPKNNLKDIHDQFLHTQFIALVDKNGKVRGHIYDALKQDELKSLSDEITVLLKAPVEQDAQ